jgi:hypothetical protein
LNLYEIHGLKSVILVKSGAKIEKRTSFWAVFEKGKQNLDSLKN